MGLSEDFFMEVLALRLIWMELPGNLESDIEIIPNGPLRRCS